MKRDEHGMQQRVAGTHSIRLDGIQDIITRFQGSSVLDIGCNRGTVCIDAERNGATLIHGCDIDEKCIEGLKGLFADYRHVKSHFIVADLTEGPRAFLPFGGQQYDIVLMLATYHKIKRVMNPEPLSNFIRHIGDITKVYFGWRATSDKPDENEQEMKALDKDLETSGLYRIHTSYISRQLGVAAIWERR